MDLMRLAVGLAIGYAAHLGVTNSDDASWRRLRFVGLAAAVSALLQMLGGDNPAPWRSVAAAGLSLVDLAVAALAVWAFAQFSRRGLRSGRALALMVVLVAAVFCGFLAGDASRPLLARNLPAALLHLTGLGLLGAFMLAALVRQLRGGHHAEQTSGRNQLLERLLLGAIQMSSLRILPELQQRIAQTVQEVFGFQRVVLHVFAGSAGVYEARAFAGIGAAETAVLASSPTLQDQYLVWTSARHRVSNSYLIGDAVANPWDDVLDATRAADGAPWPANTRLLVPLVSPAGETHGYLEAASPADGRVPDLVRLRHLEFLARFATTALESAEAHDRLARNNAEIAQASEKLKTLGQMKSNFLANVSHELRTPLTTILGFTEIVRRKGDAISPQQREEFLGTVVKEGEKLSRVIDDLLQLDRMEEGQAELERVHTDLVALARRLGETWHEQARQKGIDLTLAAAAESIVLEVDAVLCQQLLQHLIANALEFTPAGGQVHLRLAEQGTAVRIEVEDTGIGIPAEQLEQIFEHFYQVDDSSTREHGGQGVGLAICHDIISYHDGRIWAENVQPHGARFTVLLPRRPAVVIPAVPVASGRDFDDPRLFLQRVLHWVGEGLGVNLVSLMTPDSDGEHLVIRAALGLPAAVVESTRLRRGTGYAGRVWAAGRTLLLADVKADPLMPDPVDRLHYTTSSLLVVPLERNEQVVGVVMVNNRLDGRPLNEDDRLLLEAMAPHLAHLLERFDTHHDTAREFAALQTSLRATTPVGRLHHTDVASVCREIAMAAARQLALPEDDLRHLALALQFYDTGLVGLPSQIFGKKGPLTAAERERVEQHVQASLTTLEPLHPPAKVRQIILHHHERFDGSGYPAGLAGEAIPLGARLVALADSLRAMLQHRPYRAARPLAQALAEIRTLVGTHYCPRLAEPFLAEALARAEHVQRLRESADDGEDLKRPALVHPATTVRV
jgi:signal transduction histidine kinase/HD-GYP domain-containing protein (c-di-GMP phosphodiesterase class II)